MNDLRKDFFEIMDELANRDSNLILMTGDLGFSFYEGFLVNHPYQFINAGCIEQSMVSIASGMAYAGRNVYVYSNSIFLLMRAYEQIRDDICYNNLDVKLIGTGANGFLGFSHNLLETENEMDLLKNLPNIKIFYPKNKYDLETALSHNGCTFIRI